jgi:hypothetical protein
MITHMLRNAIYLFDVCLVALVLHHARVPSDFGEVRRGRAKKRLAARAQYPLANFVENSSIHTFLDQWVGVC